LTNNKNAIDMKTNYFSSKKLSIYTLFGFGVMLLVSCGSSKNTSYNDNDGIYGGTNNSSKREVVATDNKYKEYFSKLNQENQEIFTDVENYSSTNDTINKDTSVETNNNGWGSNPTTTTVIVYDNFYGNNWGWNNWYGPSWGWGWNSWYGPSWGWGWNSWYGPSWGWGWNNWYGPSWGWGWNNGYYNNHYVYGNGRRDTRYTANNRYEGIGSNRYIGSRNQSTVTPTRYNTSTSRSNTNTSRDYNTTRPRPATSNSRSNTTPSRNNNNTETRPNSTTPSRNNTYTPSNSNSRDYTPTRSNEPSRSYSPSFGGGGSSSGGGGRSSGGGGGRR